jgi:hypothetical protein
MTITAIVSHDIKDWNTFKEGFDAHDSVRTAAGITAKAYKKVDSSNTVYVIGEIPSKKVFDEFFSDPDFHKHMENIGVILPVDVTVLEEI